MEEPSSILSSPSRAQTPDVQSPSSSSTRYSSVEAESDDLPTPQASSHSGVLVPSKSQLNTSLPFPGPGSSNFRSSARLREKRKRATEGEDETEKVLEREPSEAVNDTMSERPQPRPSRPAKRRKIVHDDSVELGGFSRR